ncbi:phage holin family protein [Azorhizophilus paspali]|uniref:Phage holin family protein n=1 Tax=Azorhizophilus paspali TaxID=69963 RepID=A0ABV6SJE3_AZOPA
MAVEQGVESSLADLPTWILLLIAVAGLVGEMRQADAAGIAVGEIVKRVLLRFGSSALFGMASLFIAHSLLGDVWISGGIGIVVGLLGADIAGALYARWLAKRAGLGEQP